MCLLWVENRTVHIYLIQLANSINKVDALLGVHGDSNYE